jgi:acetylornithine deacetylase
MSADIAELAGRLIRVPSTNPGLAEDAAAAMGGEGACNEIVADELRRIGVRVETVETELGRTNVIGILPGTESGNSLALNGHVDTVGPGALEDWSVDPYGGLVDRGRVWGRGATDMKGAVAASVKAVEALATAGLRLRGDLMVQSVVGEELRDAAGVRAVLEAGHVTDACICAEPSVILGDGRRLSVQVISSPALLLRVTLRGRSTHGCLRHEWLHPGGRAGIGVNAIEHGVELVRAIQELERDWGLQKRHPLFPPGKFVLHPGLFSGGPENGDGPYLPAERCVVEYLIWHHPDESSDDVRAEIADWIARWASLDPWLLEHPPELEWWGEFRHHALDPDHELVHTVTAVHESITGSPATISSFPAGADAAVLEEFGVPTLIYGPGELAMAHAVDEYVDIEELVLAAKVYALAAMRWCELDEGSSGPSNAEKDRGR